MPDIDDILRMFYSLGAFCYCRRKVIVVAVVVAVVAAAVDVADILSIFGFLF